jgi:fructuronate reductase
MADPELVAVILALMIDDAGPTLQIPAGLDIAAYRRQVLDRFANPALRHRTTMIAADGSQKLPVRLLDVIRERLADGAEPFAAALGVAGWMVYVARAVSGQPSPGGLLPTLDDPLARHLAQAVDGWTTPAGLVASMLTLGDVFGEDLRESMVFTDLLVDHVGELLSR